MRFALLITRSGLGILRRHNWLRDAVVIKYDAHVAFRLFVEKTLEVLHASRVIRRASLDNLEVTTMIQFLIAYYGQYYRVC